jgi:hypothetical protein
MFSLIPYSCQLGQYLFFVLVCTSPCTRPQNLHDSGARPDIRPQVNILLVTFHYRDPEYPRNLFLASTIAVCYPYRSSRYNLKVRSHSNDEVSPKSAKHPFSSLLVSLFSKLHTSKSGVVTALDGHANGICVTAGLGSGRPSSLGGRLNRVLRLPVLSIPRVVTAGSDVWRMISGRQNGDVLGSVGLTLCADQRGFGPVATSGYECASCKKEEIGRRPVPEVSQKSVMEPMRTWQVAWSAYELCKERTDVHPPPRTLDTSNLVPGRLIPRAQTYSRMTCPEL